MQNLMFFDVLLKEELKKSEVAKEYYEELKRLETESGYKLMKPEDEIAYKKILKQEKNRKQHSIFVDNVAIY
jgi:hypothetical protein